ncbi:hypothetical protein [Kitasatospora sp. NPDC001095]
MDEGNTEPSGQDKIDTPGFAKFLASKSGREVAATIMLAVLATGAAVVAIFQNPPNKPLKAVPSWFYGLLVGGVAVVIVCLSVVYFSIRKGKLEEEERKRRALESAADRLREKMELPSLVDFNRTLLDTYHDIATKQAQKAYRSSIIAFGVGLAVMATAFVAGWNLNSNGDRLFVGSVGVIGASFTTYLSRTYMQTYERALQQLNQYFNQPVLNGYFLTAERLTLSLPEEQRTVAVERIIADVLESGKEMHRGALSGLKGSGVPTPRRQPRRTNQQRQEPQLPA